MLRTFCLCEALQRRSNLHKQKNPPAGFPAEGLGGLKPISVEAGDIRPFFPVGQLTEQVV